MKKIILFALGAVLLSSCGDFLEETPRHDWEIGNSMTSYSSAQQAVNGIYGEMMPGDALNMALNVSYNTRSGLSNINGSNDYNFAYKQSNGPSSLWSSCYAVLNACNLAVNNIPKISDSSFPNETAKTELVAEARFMRGYINSILMLNYCLWWDKDESAYGLVYKDKVSDLSNLMSPRITVGESWNNIFEDIQFGIDNMPEKFATPRRASKLFAKAYKAKLLLIRGAQIKSNEMLSEAKTLVDNCISSLPSNVKMQPDMAKHFADSWDSSENIFVRYLEDVSGRTSLAGYWCNYGFGYNAATNCIINDIETLQADAVCGLEYGLDWMHADPRWFISTGKARKPETWDDSYAWTWTKIYRQGKIAGQEDPIDEKYAIYFMRLPELYIMQAELRARTGASLADAIAPINVMRSKRTNPLLDPVPTPANEQALWDAIFQEYVKELIFENGCEYWASLRIMKDGIPYMAHIKGPNFIYDQSKLQWPIPEDEMKNNTALAGMQNPGQE